MARSYLCRLASDSSKAPLLVKRLGWWETAPAAGVEWEEEVVRQPPRVPAKRAFIAITVLLAMLGSAAFASGSPRQPHNPQAPAEIADVVALAAGQVLGVAQDQDEIAWLEASASGCRLHVRSLTGGAKRVIRWAPRCLAAERDLALAGGRTAWGGYEEVRCSETTAAVYVSESSPARLVQEIPGDCLGFGTSFQGLVTDGDSFFYALLTTRPKPDSSRCGEGGRCRWRLAGGHIVRIAGLRPATARALPAAALIAAAAGRVALVQPAASAAARGRGPFDWPRAADNGSVEIRDTKRGGS
jgi:hypothetical protein